ncbi:GntR family transcriptional regulator [Pseudooceanicola algae]|uniref:HTH-type transcriptional regulator GmuR n=1 Tax=Pseudooceanicola algae TaxID=1537215 RepID=A0A418SHJ1_9RHOB|nr:GntR family transcriptional regulator [Pseudooceanicola algae]QPM90464.1 HTH-type transcriptional regulator GmuR [Pseudooceanicola algae]
MFRHAGETDHASRLAFLPGLEGALMAPRGRAPRRIGQVPLYEMVDGELRQRLLQKVYPPGAMIPSEMKLAAELGVSQGTVRRALNGLVDEGLLTRRQGLGTFVPEIEDRRSLFLFFNMIGHDGQHELPPARLESCEIGAATQAEADRLALPPQSPVRRLLRVRLLRDRPTILERIVVAEAVLPGLGEGGALPDHLFRHYERSYGRTVTSAEERLRAAAASFGDAELLEIAPGTPLLEIDRLAFEAERTPVEWRRSLCNTSAHDYLVDRR